MRRFLILSTSLIGVILLTAGSAWATHIRAGEIRVEVVDCQTLRYRVTLIGYTNTASATQFGGGQLTWNGGSATVPEGLAVQLLNADLHIGRATYSTIVTFPSEGTYTIGYTEGHRNIGLLNIDNSKDDQDFYVDTQIKVSKTGCDSSPSFLVPPVDEACQGSTFYHDPGASDINGDSLSFAFTIPKASATVLAKAYTDPNTSTFYTSVGIDFSHANQDKTGPPTFAINATTGLVTWDAPGAAGIYNIAIKVTEWKKNPADSSWFEAGYAVRDMQIIVEQCPNHAPVLSDKANLCVDAGALIDFTIFGSDPDHDPVKIEVFSDALGVASSPPTLSPATDVYQSTTPPKDTAHMHFRWQTDCSHVQVGTYKVVFKATDKPVNGAALVVFRTITIKVNAPAPVMSAPTINPVKKELTLHWSAYSCFPATGIQVWRRVSSFSYAQPVCETGMPASLRYTLLGVVDPAATSYVDKDLSIGARYCYRLVAIGPDGLTSHLSQEFCEIPQPAKAPVITHVTVIKTDSLSGNIRVSWRSPFDIDKVQYPAPYKYEVYRSKGMYSTPVFTKVSGLLSDTTFLDGAIPTVDTAYRYQVVLYVPTLSDQPVDTSGIASSVRLKAKANGHSIVLTWDARTPWSNNLQNFPRHQIYRNDVGVNGPYTLIDSVDVNENGFTYEDLGAFQQQPLDDHKIYYYKVATRGGYGNPRIAEPLLNFSQVVYDHLLDTIPPCAPVVRINNRPCNMIDCADTYFNVVKWRAVEGAGCQNDIVAFEIYTAVSSDSTFRLLDDQVLDSAYLHRGLKDMAVCYKVKAVDWMGNKSKFSNTICGANCPRIQMPNVFTPDITEGHNDVFQAFGEDSQHPGFGPHVCTRFVESLTLTIYDRWGLTVYKSKTDKPMQVQWDGKDHAGNEVPAGVYYYNAKAVFKLGDKEREEQTLKGWVQLLR